MNTPLLFAYISDATEPEKRAPWFGALLGSVAGGLIIGAFVGSIIGYEKAVWAPVFATVFTAGYVIFLMPESLRDIDRVPFSISDTNPIQVLRYVTRNSLISRLSLIISLTSFSNNGVLNIILLYLRDQMHFSPTDNSVLLAIGALSTIVTQGVVLKQVVDRWGERTLLLSAMLCDCIAAIGYAIAWEGWQFFALVYVHAVASLSTSRLRSGAHSRLTAH